MNHDQKEADRLETELAGFIYDQAMAMHAEAVVVCDVEESSDLLESFRCGVKEGIAVTMMIQEDCEIEAEEEAGFIYDQAMAMHAEAVVACDVEESSDLLESFRCGVKEGIAVTMMIQEDCEIEAEEKAARAANKTK